MFCKEIATIKYQNEGHLAAGKQVHKLTKPSVTLMLLFIFQDTNIARNANQSTFWYP